MSGLHQQDKLLLAIVLVSGDAAKALREVRRPFTQEPDRAVTRINRDLDALLAVASASARSLPGQ